MGLLSVSGAVETPALSALSCVFAGLLFDDLCDACQDYAAVQAELRQLFEAAARAEPRQQFLLICLQYDRISQALPDPPGGSAEPLALQVISPHFSLNT